MIENDFLSIGITICLLGASTFGYLFGVVTNRKKVHELEKVVRKMQTSRSKTHA
jgi:hypothetical protein